MITLTENIKERYNQRWSKDPTLQLTVSEGDLESILENDQIETIQETNKYSKKMTKSDIFKIEESEAFMNIITPLISILLYSAWQYEPTGLDFRLIPVIMGGPIATNYIYHRISKFNKYLKQKKNEDYSSKTFSI